MSALLPSDSALGGSPTETPEDIESGIATIERAVARRESLSPLTTRWLLNQLRSAREAYARLAASTSRETPE